MAQTALSSEDQILDLISRYFPERETYGEHVLLGRGDDCAVLDVSGPLCVSTDLFLEDVHFRRSYCTPEDVGWKALAVNLSDLAACGARPIGFTLGLALPNDADAELVHGLCAGMAQLSRQHEVPLVGGDLSQAERLHLCLTVFGQAEKTLLRETALPGDILFMVGKCGLARAGLEVLEAEGRRALEQWPVSCAAHLRPEPRLKEGIRLSKLAATWILESGVPEKGRLGLMDLSDGLARDVPRLVGKGKGAKLSLPAPHPELIRLMEQRGKPDPIQAATEHMYFGGEDYALIGSCDSAFAAQLMVTLAEAVVIGRITDDGKVTLDGRELAGGFDHFTRRT